MNQIFDIDHTVRTYRLYFDDHSDVLEELLRSVTRCLRRALPPEVSRQVDQEGATLERDSSGALRVRRHPALERARKELARLGLFRIFLPAPVGGFDLPLCLYYLAVQQISYFDTSLALVFLVHGNALYVINRFGTEAQKQAYLPDLAAGARLATVAFTEPMAGSDAGSIRTRAEKQGGEYVLSGDKLFITNGGDADLLVTTARTGPLEQGIQGVSTFIVERQADGVELVGLEDKTGLAGSPTAALSYPGIRIPADRLLGAEGQGGAVMFAGVGMTRVNIGAQALGIARRAFDAAAAFALQRQQGGRTIIRHDAIQHRLSSMALIISAMENLICHDSFLEHQGQWHVLEMSVAKYYASEALQELTLRAINIFGGYGVCKDQEVERCRREATALPLYGGTSEIQWLIISRELIGELDHTSHAPYRARYEQRAQQLERRCQGPLEGPARRANAAQQRLWRAVEAVAAKSDPIPLHRHLAELAVSLAVAQALLWQASSNTADDLDRELSLWAVDQLEDRAAVCCGRIHGDVRRASLHRAVVDRLL